MNKQICLVPCVAVMSLLANVTVVAGEASAPKPTPEHKLLGYFVGTWKTDGKMAASEMGPAGTMTSIDTCSWFDGGFAVVCKGDGKSTMGPMKSLGILGYNTEEKVYTYHGIDSSGYAMTSVPRGKRQGDTWTYDEESMMGGKKVKSRVTIKELSATAYTFKMDMQGADGKWATVMESKSTKTE